MSLVATFACDQSKKEYNLISNEIFKKFPEKAVRFFCEEGFVVCFHWGAEIPHEYIPVEVWEWVIEEGCLGIMACDSHTLPESLQFFSLGLQHDPDFKGSMMKKFTGTHLEIHNKDGK